MAFLTILLFSSLTIPTLLKTIKIKKETKEKIMLFTMFIILFIFSAFRHIEMGNDTRSYYVLFETLKPWTFTNTYYEKGFLVFNSIIKIFFKDPQYLFIISSLINLGAIFIFLKRESLIIWLSIFLFISTRLYFTNISAIRQSLSMSIILLSLPFFKKNKHIIFIIMIIIAATLHKSALFFLVIYLTKFFEISKKTIIITVIISGLILIIPYKFLEFLPYFSKYLGSVHDNAARPAAIIETIVAIIIFTVSIMYKNYKNSLFLKISLISIIVSFLGIKSSVASRLYLYFIPFNIILLTNTLYSIRNKFDRILLKVSVVVLFSLYLYITFIYRPEWSNFIPYKFYWN